MAFTPEMYRCDMTWYRSPNSMHPHQPRLLRTASTPDMHSSSVQPITHLQPITPYPGSRPATPGSPLLLHNSLNRDPTWIMLPASRNHLGTGIPGPGSRKGRGPADYGQESHLTRFFGPNAQRGFRSMNARYGSFSPPPKTASSIASSGGSWAESMRALKSQTTRQSRHAGRTHLRASPLI